MAEILRLINIPHLPQSIHSSAADYARQPDPIGRVNILKRSEWKNIQIQPQLGIFDAQCSMASST